MINHSVGKSLRCDRPCMVCHAPNVVERFDMSALETIVVLKFLIFEITNGKIEKKKCNIKAIPTTTVRINQDSYTVLSAIFHHGDNIEHGHFTSMLRSKDKKGWISVDDLKVEKRSWPRNGKDLYILFLQRV